MAGRRVVGVAGLVRLVAVGELERDLALDDVAEVRALAAVVGQALEERRQVGVGRVRLERDRVAVEILEMALVAFDLLVSDALAFDAFGMWPSFRRVSSHARRTAARSSSAT